MLSLFVDFMGAKMDIKRSLFVYSWFCRYCKFCINIKCTADYCIFQEENPKEFVKWIEKDMTKKI